MTRGNMARYFTAALVIFSFAVFGLLIAPVSASTGHNCAWPVPPGVPGNPSPAPAAGGVIVINEVLLSPHSTWNCSEQPGTYFDTTDSWIELYNTQNYPYNLYSAHATIDSGPNTNPFYFPFGASIAAHSYLVVFPRTNQGFTSTETSTLRLVISNVVLDQVTVPPLLADQSYARTSDGASSWGVTSTPTIDASNASSFPPTPSSSSGSGTGSGTGTIPTGATTPSMISGTQTVWQKLSIAMLTPTPTISLVKTKITLAPNTSPATPTTTTTGLDVIHRIILTILVIALGFTLFWGWRVFRKA
jgi:hypothetical protein